MITSTSGIYRLMFGVGGIQVLRGRARRPQGTQGTQVTQREVRDDHLPPATSRDSVEESVSHCQPKLNRKGQELLMARNPEGRLNILKPLKSETTAQYCIDSPTLIEP